MNKTIAMLVAVGCVASVAATNYDLLGRKGSKMNSPMVYKDVDYLKMKAAKQQGVNSSLENKSLMKKISGLVGPEAMEGGFSTVAMAYSARGTPYYFYMKRFYENQNPAWDYRVDLDAYLELSNEVFYNTYIVRNATPSGQTTSNDVTLMYGFNVNEQYDYSAFDPTSFYSLEFDNNKLNRGNVGWFDNGYGNNNGQCQECGDVGIYLDADSYPVRLDQSKTAKYVALGNNINNISHHELEVASSKAYSILQATTKNAAVYVTNTPPPFPAGKTPQVYVGLHNRKISPEVGYNAATYYSAEAQALDNYIYENRTVDVVAAGDYYVNSSNAPLNPQAHAVNAITVGAVDAGTGKIASYTSENSRYCKSGIGNCPGGSYRNGSRKPEIYNYSEFFMPGDSKRTYVNWFTQEPFPYSPNYELTESAASYTAGMVADLLRANPFYRWHPEVVKALLLTSGDINIGTPYPHSTPVTSKIPSYRSVVFNRFHTDYYHESRYWIGNLERLQTHGSSAQKEIRFSIRRPTNKHNFTAAIAWLTSGDDIADLGKIPQDFDLYVYESSTGEVDNLTGYKTSSTSGSNAYEKISFNSSAEYLVFRILLFSEEDDSENKGQAVLGFDMAAAN